MSTTRPYELLARWGDDGKVVGVHTRTLTTLDNGRVVEDSPVPLKDATDPEFTAFAEAFAAAVVAERNQLRVDLDAATALTASLQENLVAAQEAESASRISVEELTTIKAELESTLTEMTAELESTLAAMTAELDVVKAENETIKAERVTLQTTLQATISEHAAIAEEMNARIAAMTAHPDVAADRKAKEIEAARQAIVDAKTAKADAEKRLTELGETVVGGGR
jgi:chromosome segregation ATPase